jgi:hypothetical protein
MTVGEEYGEHKRRLAAMKRDGTLMAWIRESAPPPLTDEECQEAKRQYEAAVEEK